MLSKNPNLRFGRLAVVVIAVLLLVGTVAAVSAQEPTAGGVLRAGVALVGRA